MSQNFWCRNDGNKNFVWKVPLSTSQSKINLFLGKTLNSTKRNYIYVPTDYFLIEDITETHLIFFYEMNTNRILFHGVIIKSFIDKFPDGNYLYTDIYNRPFLEDIPKLYYKVLFQGILLNHYLETKPDEVMNWNLCTWNEMMMYKNHLYMYFYEEIYFEDFSQEI